MQDLAVQQHAQAILERQVVGIRLGELVGQGIMHAGHLGAALAVTPGAIVLAELAVAVRLVTVGLDVLRPQQLQGHALVLERLVDLEVVRCREAHRRRLGREQSRLQRSLVGAVRQQPADAGDLRQADVLADRALGEAAGPSNLLVAEAGVVLEAQHCGDGSHGNPRCWHVPSRGEGQKEGCAVKVRIIPVS